MLVHDLYGVLMAYDAIRAILIIGMLCSGRPRGTVDFILISDDLIPDYTDSTDYY